MTPLDLVDPQMPEDSVLIPAASHGVTLAGAFERPARLEAAALLLPGSGPQDRDETIAGQKPLLVLAQRLSERGIASLRCDDRGVGASGGDYLAIDAGTLLADARAQLAWLAAQCPGAPLAVVGHSQGALFALRLAEAENQVSSVVLLGAAIRPGMEFMLDMRRQMAEDAGLTGVAREAYVEHSKGLFSAIAGIDDPAPRAKAVRRLILESVAGASDADFAPDFANVEEFVECAVAEALEWEVRELLRSDPAATLARLSIPVLALWGALDRHVAAEAEQAAFQRAAPAGSASHVLSGMNHLFQRTATGQITAYATDGPPMCDPAPDQFAQWIRAASSQ